MFILGNQKSGFWRLGISFATCGIGVYATAPLGMIEAIMYLTKSDEEFYQTYVVEQKPYL